MATVTYGGETYTCSKAVKGADYVHLFDSANRLIYAFDVCSDLTAFTISGGTWANASTPNFAAATVTDGVLNITTAQRLEDGVVLEFTAPCACTSVTSFSINEAAYSLVDAAGTSIIGRSGAWAQSGLLSILLDVTNSKAYLQNSAAAAIPDATITNDKLDLSGGFAPAGVILLTENVHYGTALPDDAAAGTLFFKVV